MKKKSIFILSILILSLALSACSPEGLSYLNDIQKVQKWEATEQESKTVINLKLPKAQLENEDVKALKEMGMDIPESYKITIDVKGYSNNDLLNPEAKIFMDMKDESGLFNIENVEILVNKDHIYISKNYIDSILSIDEDLKVEIPEEVKYFVLDSEMNDENYIKIAQMASNTDYLKEIGEVFKSLDMDIDIKKENNSYTIDMDSDKLLDIVEKSLNNIVENPNKVIDKLKDVKILGLTEEYIEILKESLKDMDKESLNEMKKFISETKPMIKGSSLKIKETITDNTYDSKSDVNIKVDGFVEGNITTDTKTKKVSKKTITFPKKEETKDFNEFMASITPTIKSVSIDRGTKTLSDYNVDNFDDLIKDIAIKEFDKVEMYGFRRIFESLGFEVDYDKIKEKPLYIVDGEKIFVDIPEVNGISYISIEKLKELGLEVDQFENIISITHTIEPEAKQK